MPTIYSHVETEVEVDVDVNEFLDLCSNSEIQKIKIYLHENETNSNVPFVDKTKMTLCESDFVDMIYFLSSKYYIMTKEETNLIESLYNKYK